jgi:hypothetical protein
MRVKILTFFLSSSNHEAGAARKKKGKRVYLNDVQTRDLMKQLKNFFESYIDVTRMSAGKKQTIETLINEEALVLAKFLRNERNRWIPRTIV